MNQTDKRAFEAKLDEYVQRYVEALDATDGVGTEEAKQARAAVLAAYYAGREGQPVSSIDYWQKRGHHVCPECNGTRVRSYRQADHLGGQYVDVPCECTHPAPKADDAADWVCVPREPTAHMCHEGHAVGYGYTKNAGYDYNGADHAQTIYRAMLAASPARVGEGDK